MAHLKKRPDGTCILTVGFRDGTIAHQEEVERILEEHAGHGETAAYVFGCIYWHEHQEETLSKKLDKLLETLIQDSTSFKKRVSALLSNSNDGCDDIRASFED